MDLPDFESFVNRESDHLSVNTIKKLHSNILLNKDNKLTKWLEKILERRLECSFRKGKAYVDGHPFVHRDWLEAAGNC